MCPSRNMHILIVHHEAQYFAGAEKMLGYYLEGLTSSGHQVTVGAVRDSRVREVIPEGQPVCWLPSNARFSPLAFWRQARALQTRFRSAPFDLIHGWAARDWELAALTAKL